MYKMKSSNPAVADWINTAVHWSSEFIKMDNFLFYFLKMHDNPSGKKCSSLTGQDMEKLVAISSQV